MSRLYPKKRSEKMMHDWEYTENNEWIFGCPEKRQKIYLHLHQRKLFIVCPFCGKELKKKPEIKETVVIGDLFCKNCGHNTKSHNYDIKPINEVGYCNRCSECMNKTG